MRIIRKINGGFVLVILSFFYIFIVGLIAAIKKPLFFISQKKQASTYWIDTKQSVYKLNDFESPY